MIEYAERIFCMSGMLMLDDPHAKDLFCEIRRVYEGRFVLTADFYHKIKLGITS